MKTRRLFAAMLALIMVCSIQISSPLTVLSAVDPLRNGLRGDYYVMNNQSYTFDRYMLTAVDSNINWQDTKTMLKQRAGADEYVTVRWTGFIKTPAGGSDAAYTFSTSTDDSLRLWVNDTQMINWWGNQWDANSNTWGHSGTITLSPDTYYPFTMEYSQGHGGAFARIRWQRTTGGAEFPYEIIPADAFFLDDSFRAPLIAQVGTEAVASGKLTLSVQDFTDNTVLKMYQASDTMQLSPIAVDYVKTADDAVSIELPEDTKGGIYRLIAEDTVGGTLYRTSSENFSTMVLEGQPRSEYPRPDFARDYAWESLNGPWDFKFDRENNGTAEWAETGLPGSVQTIMVPYPWQSPASGIYDETNPAGIAWYQREFTPAADKYAGKRVFLRFGAVDAECWLYVNGEPIGFSGDGVTHNGGYTPFEFDITDDITLDEINTITLKVRDLGNYGDNSYTALIGKQGRNAPCGYAGTSGIWQSVYLEGRFSETQLDYVHVNPLVNNGQAVVDANKYDITNGIVPVDGSAKIKAAINGGAGKTLDLNYEFKAMIWDDTLNQYIDAQGASLIAGTTKITVPAGSDSHAAEFTVSVPNQQLWSPDEPNLYVGAVTLRENGTAVDSVTMHFGQRDFHNAYWATSPGPDSAQRYQYTLLNNKPIFLAGLLDQGFWQEGVYTAPTEEALKYDIKAMREDGFNMIRKHLKIEDPLQYLWCDRLGMVLWQDMPHATNMNTNGGQDGSGRPLYEAALDDLIERDYNHPSLMAYILFNETWGISRNADTAAWVRELYDHVKATDDSGRIVEEMSPCNNDHIQPTDMNTFHNYQGSWSAVRNTYNNRDNNTYIGSRDNFTDWTAANGGGNVQDGDPFMNSEYGGVGAYDGDWDISWCFKYQTDVLRLRQKLQGYVYTEPYDVEYERNGILTYDRRRKVMGYETMAYGGDMSIKNLNQPEYVGFDKDPMVSILPGDVYNATIGAIRWSDQHQGPFTLKWRVDGVDQFGNSVNTAALADAGFRGEKTIAYTPYVYETAALSFTVPLESRFNRFAGTVTAWIVDGSGETIAKNFTNFKVMSPIASKAAEEIGEDSFVLRQTTPAVNT
ncbi:MAG: hypothetical protein LBU77_06490, partial [Clostridiales bacterium]|nr:hypothetical protein [Clostridiales bacterium]